ncbi:phage protein Gp36 family protein [Shewanella xiamenensis]|uniref:phage protein Gp36 family protein n=1 Tax=Shewanella xiamenensis TaxID=332186 RepID=UPI000849851A|nr:phage protein Gp36 family protein [Shewanella xiamenensis]ODR86711.1 hypothetical protein ABT47_16070 [Shewanella xiamenensis]
MYCTVLQLMEWHTPERLVAITPAKAPHNRYLVTPALLRKVATGEDVTGEDVEAVAATHTVVEKLLTAISTASQEADGYLLRRYGTRMQDKVFIDQLRDETILPERVGGIAIERLAIGSDQETEQVTRLAVDARRWLREVADAKVELGIQSTQVRATQDYSHTQQTRSRIDWGTY